MIKLKDLLNEANDTDYKKAALELVKVAEPMVKGKGYVDMSTLGASGGRTGWRSRYRSS